MGFLDRLFSRLQAVPREWEDHKVERIRPATPRPAGPRPHAAQAGAPPRPVFAKQRRHPRYSVESRGIHAYLYAAQVVELLNLSVSGVCIRSRKGLGLGSSHILQISAGAAVISPRCAVIWKREDPSGGYVHGMRFQCPSTDEVVRLKDFMRLWGVPDDKEMGETHKAGALRFLITSHEKALLTNPEALDVKKISMGGLLMASSCSMEPEDRFRLKIDLAGGTEAIRATGRVASVIRHAQGSHAQFDVGVEFLGMETTDRERLDRFIHSL